MDAPARASSGNGVSRHKCLIYDGHPSESLPVVVPLMIEALSENRRCLYLGDPAVVDSVWAALTEAGLDVNKEVERGALVFSSERPYAEDGAFDPAAMVAGLRDLVDRAVGDGFLGLHATGDMRWELGGDRNFERLREYEARLELVFRDKPLSGVCQYHRDTVPARAVQDALVTHRAAYLGRELNKDNLFYIPPEFLLQEDPSHRERLAEWMWRQMSRITRAESDRDLLLQQLTDANRLLESRVRERTADIEAFGYSLSHDLRAHIRAIDGFCREISRRGTESGMDAASLGHFERVLSATDRMSQLVDAMLELFRVSHAELETASVDLSAAAETIVAGLRRGEPTRAVAVEIEPGLRAKGDPRLLHSLLENLLGNAWKFTSDTPLPRVSFGAAPFDERPGFAVRDNGAGFDPARADRLFMPFSRLHGASEFPGSGVGLAIARRIVARHGGDIRAEAVLGEGATFSFVLPL